jgi:antitoxin CcdA
MRSVREAAKRPINLSLNSKVLDMAKEMGLNISQTVDALLTEEVMRRYGERWNEDNREAIEAYNARIEREGTFSQRIRKHLAQAADVDGTPR